MPVVLTDACLACVLDWVPALGFARYDRLKPVLSLLQIQSLYWDLEMGKLIQLLLRLVKRL